MKPTYKNLSRKDCLSVLELIAALQSCENEAVFRSLIGKLSMLIQFDFAICGISKLSSQGDVSSYQIINYNYPSEWLNLYLSGRFDRIDPIVLENYSDYRLQYWADTFKQHDEAWDFIRHARDFKLNDGYTTGLRDKNNRGSIFTISGGVMPRCGRTEIILDILMPHFHLALTRLNGLFGVQQHTLSMREIEVLNWLKHGKTSWDVSQILNISERTVNYHCASVMQKLDAVSRSHALAIAIDKGIISLE